MRRLASAPAAQRLAAPGGGRTAEQAQGAKPQSGADQWPWHGHFRGHASWLFPWPAGPSQLGYQAHRRPPATSSWLAGASRCNLAAALPPSDAGRCWLSEPAGRAGSPRRRHSRAARAPRCSCRHGTSCSRSPSRGAPPARAVRPVRQPCTAGCLTARSCTTGSICAAPTLAGAVPAMPSSDGRCGASLIFST